MSAFTRRRFIQAAAVGGAASVAPFRALAMQTATAAEKAAGYGPLVDKGDLFLPAAFNYQIISRQGEPMNDGRPTPGIFDGMGAFIGTAGATTLIRNHENREQAGEQKVVTGPGLEYDPAAFGGNTKLEVVRTKTGERDPATGQPLYAYEVVNQFAILGGTSTNCAGGYAPPKKWITCEEVVKRTNGIKHGYAFEIDSRSDVPVAAIPIRSAGRRAHEAAFWLDKALYMTEDRRIAGTGGSCFYRWVPDSAVGASGNLADVSGVLLAAKLRSEPRANMDVGRVVGQPYPVEWVTVDEPDHDDDTDNRRDRVPGFTPNRFQAQDKGACFFDRLEGMWVDHGKLYFAATAGGPADLGQVWEYDQGRETLTLIYESSSAATLQSPDNVVIVPQTGDIFLQEDGPGDQYVRGVTQDGRIYDFAKTGANDSEFCGGCFDPDGQTFYLNQQGGRGSLPHGPVNDAGVTYAIYGPFAQRDSNRSRSFGNGPAR
ncbi:MAG TPA: alkaline phosphatase PhoX [Mycobacteriales bacterium]|nr:alkaline phosphatase PhoX [Mycobacteriales bacterium]